MRRFALFVVVAGGVFAPAAPAFAHGGDTPDATAYRTTITGLSAPEPGLSVRTVEAGSRLELTNHTGHSIEVLGYDGEPYLDVRPDGTYQNVNSPAVYPDRGVPEAADPTAPPAWRKVSPATTVRWHDQRTHWLDQGVPPPAAADPTRPHRLRDWTVPLREQARVFELRGTLDWVPPPRTTFWWLAGLASIGLAHRWSGTIRPLTLITGLSPLAYAVIRATDGAPVPLVLVPAGLLALAAAWRRPPFLLALSGVVVAIFGGVNYASAFDAGVLPTAGPDWLARSLVLISAGLGTGLAVTGVLGLRRLPAPQLSSAP